MSLVNQQKVLLGSIAEQPMCCNDFPAGSQFEPIGGSYLRQFDPETGCQVLDENGRPKLVRSPTRPIAVAVFVHIDGTTSGILPGIPTPPIIPNASVNTGTFYLLGIFPLAALAMD